MAVRNLPSLVSDSNLARYLAEIRQFPMLEQSEEFMLAKRWQEHQDTEAAHKMVTSHLRLVAKIAMGYRGYGLPMSEVISEGNVGLMQAVKRFDPDKGFRLATYAMWWIRAAIQEYILHSWSLVKIGTTAAQKKLFFNLRRVKGQLKALEEGDLRPETVKEIATRLDVPESDVVDMNRRLAAPDHSLNAPVRMDGEGEWQEWLVDETDSQETMLAESQEFGRRQKLLDRALKLLNPGGTLVTCSCSYNVNEAVFAEIVYEAAVDARVHVMVVEKRMQARDHPVLLGVPETYYLKCFILRKLA